MRASSSRVRINHLLRHGPGRRRAEVHAVALAHLLLEPHCKRIRAPGEFGERRLRMIAFERDEHQIAFWRVLQERPLAHTKAASRCRELGLASSFQLADELLPLFGLARWNRKRHRQYRHYVLLVGAVRFTAPASQRQAVAATARSATPPRVSNITTRIHSGRR